MKDRIAVHITYIIIIATLLYSQFTLVKHYQDRVVEVGAAMYHPKTGKFLWKDEVINLNTNTGTPATSSNGKVF